LPAMDYIAVMVPESSLGRARQIVAGVEATMSEAREAVREMGELPDDPIAAPC